MVERDPDFGISKRDYNTWARHADFRQFVTDIHGSAEPAVLSREINIPHGAVYRLLVGTRVGNLLVLPGEELTSGIPLALGEGGPREALVTKEVPDRTVITTAFEYDQSEDDYELGEPPSWSTSVQVAFHYVYPDRSIAVQEVGLVLLSGGQFGFYHMAGGFLSNGLLFSDRTAGFNAKPKEIKEFMKNMATLSKAAASEPIKR